MPRPPDTYTHQQFEPVESDFLGETVRCVHCKSWTGSVKTLNRKKDHLLKCSAYAAWRAAGHGQELAPPNRYNKRDSSALNDTDLYSSPYGDVNYSGPQYTPTTMTSSAGRARPFDVTQYYEEFWDQAEGSSAQKCMRARCKYCGNVRAKNTTRQVEHLQACTEFHKSTEGTAALADGSLQNAHLAGIPTGSGGRDIYRGTAPNPNLAIIRPARQRQSAGRPNNTPSRPPAAPTRQAPSLIAHVLNRNRTAVDDATQQQFLSHAGIGTLSSVALQQWLGQQAHVSRALISCIGQLIGKLRLPDVPVVAADSTWRCLDLLVSALNNSKRELEFLRTTQNQYGLQTDRELPQPAAKGMIDLLNSAASPSATLLEGMLVLWAVEHLLYASWQYAHTFVQAPPSNPTAYALPTYLQGGADFDVNGAFNASQANADNAHVNAVHRAFIPNWTSQGFVRFVDACKSIVDELANNQTTGSGAVELNNCLITFTQLVWLWKQIWPEVTGMGEEKEQAADQGVSTHGNSNGHGADGPTEIQDDEMTGRDEDAPGVDSPFGGTGLGVVDAANRAS